MSALESAALLHETGAQVEVIARAPRVYFLRQRLSWLHRLGPITRWRRERKPIGRFPAIRARFVQPLFQRLIVDAAAVAM